MFLNRIVETKKAEVASLKERASIQSFEREIADLAAPKPFFAALAESRNRPMGLIAEVKKASPSKGLIRADFDPVALARQYEAAGADCISVLTDVDYFQGADAYLQAIREAVAVPLLRKDFTIDPIQIYEARALGADAVLLIAAILETEQMRDFMELAESLGMAALVEVHDEAELDRALAIEARLIGINNRNLHTFETNLQTTAVLAERIPQGRLIVSESGISEPSQIESLRRQRAEAVLIGEHFMRQPDPGVAVNRLMGERINA